MKGKEPDKEELKKAIKKLHVQAGVLMAKDSYRKIMRQVQKSYMSDEERWKLVIISYLESQGLDKLAEDITNTSKEDIRKILMRGEFHGMSIYEMGVAIEKLGISAYRSELIARTETSRAANHGAILGSLSTGMVTVKEWISVQDNRTRRIPRDNYDHLHMDGKQAKIDQPFIVPGLKTIDIMYYPGDPNGSAGNVCNCRCTVGFEVARDSQMRPVRLEDGPALTGPIGQLHATMKNTDLLRLQNMMHEAVSG